MKRFLSCEASEIKKMNREELIASIRASEGIIILSESIVTSSPLVSDITNAEVSRAAGADLILLKINGLDKRRNPIKRIKELVGRPVGCNLEPVNLNAEMLYQRLEVSYGRQVNEKTLNALNDLGVDFCT